MFYSEIKERYREGKYVEALCLIEAAEKQGFIHPDLLLWKGRCLQLIDADSSHQLSDIENAFKDALKIDDTFAPAAVELAWFYLNVLNDAGRAAEVFEASINSYKEALTEAVVGKAKCLMETESNDVARDYLVSFRCLDGHEVDKFLEEIDAIDD